MLTSTAIVSLDGSWSFPEQAVGLIKCPMPGAQADNIRRSILKRSCYLTKSGICMPTFHVAQIHIRRDISRNSDVRPILKNLVMPLPNLRWTSQCPVSRQNFTKICFNSGLISLSNSRCERNLGFMEWTWLAACSVQRSRTRSRPPPMEGATVFIDRDNYSAHSGDVESKILLVVP